MKITGRYYTDQNFINVCTNNTLYTMLAIRAIGVVVKSETKPALVCSTAKHIRQSWSNAPKQAHLH